MRTATNCLNLDLQDLRINRIMQKYPQILKILLILGILVQTIALTACDKVPDDIIDDYTQQTAESSSSLDAETPSSSSSDAPNPSSSSGGSGEIECDPFIYEGQEYKTVKIGEQCWMAENLNYNARGSECQPPPAVDCLHIEGTDCLISPEHYCSIYGRLYDWETAMYSLITNCGGIPEDYPTNCISTEPRYPNKGICPAGWHIPSKGEWEELFDYVASIRPYYREAGVQLKAKEGWNEWQWVCPCAYSETEPLCVCTAPPPYRGEDTYGFAALPGGILASSYGVLQVAGFFDMGKYGYWWSATEDTGRSAANSRMSYDSGKADFGFAGSPSSSKDSKMSVRCVKD